MRKLSSLLKGRFLLAVIFIAAALILSAGLATLVHPLHVMSNTISSAIDFLEPEPIPWQQSNESNFTYEPVYKRFLTARDNMAFASSADILMRSADNGRSYSQVLDIRPDYIVQAHVLDGGNVVGFSRNGTVYYSQDGKEFILSARAGIDRTSPPYYSGVDSHGDTVIFAEYNVTDGIGYRIIRSADGGRTWSVVLSKANPGEIRHWHTVDYNRYSGYWYTTSGDDNGQVKWYVSKDDGITWSGIDLPYKMNPYVQVFRNTGLYFTSADDVWWGADSSAVRNDGTLETGIYHGRLSNMSCFERVATLPCTCIGLVGDGSTMIAITTLDKNDTDYMNYIYVSNDSGKTWHADLKWPATGSRGGFMSISGPDSKGSCYLGVFNMTQAGTDPILGVKMTLARAN